MNSFPTLAILCLAAVMTLTANAQDGEVSTNPPALVETTPADLVKARQTLEKIQAKVHEKNPDLVRAVSSDLQTQDLYITNSITLSLMVQGKIYNELGVDVSVRETSLAIDRITSAKLHGNVKVNGYELVKRTLSSRDGKPSDEEKAQNLERGAKACERAQSLSTEQLRNNTTAAEDFLDCALNYYLLKSNTFSEFLVSVKPIAGQFKKLANDAYYNELKKQTGPYGAFFIYHLFTGNTFTVCTASIWEPLCLGREYIDIGVNFGVFGVTHANAGLYITKENLEFSLSVSSFHVLANLLAGGQQQAGGLYIPISDVKNYVISKLATMSDADIDENAKDISSTIDSFSKELDKLGIQ